MKQIFTDDFESCTVSIIFETSDGKIIQSGQITAPIIVLKSQFLNYVNEVSHREDPLVVTMKRTVPVWSQCDQKMIGREAFVRFMNNAYLSWMDAQKEKNGE